MTQFTWPEDIPILKPNYFSLGTLILITFHGWRHIIDNNHPHQWLVMADHNKYLGLACTDKFRYEPSCEELTKIIKKIPFEEHHKTLEIVDPSELPLFVNWSHTPEYFRLMKEGK